MSDTLSYLAIASCCTGCWSQASDAVVIARVDGLLLLLQLLQLLLVLLLQLLLLLLLL